VRNFVKICLFLKLVNSDKYFSRPILDFSLLYKNNFDSSEYDESFSLKKIFTHGIPYTFANNIFKEFDLNIKNYSNIDKSFEKVKYSIKTQLRKVVTEKDRNKFKEKLSSYSDESKLFLYSKLKSSIGLEKYLSELTSFKNRQILTKFRNFLFTFKASATSGLILFVFNLEKYTIT
jgi:hypothetical protein